MTDRNADLITMIQNEAGVPHPGAVNFDEGIRKTIPGG